MSRRKQQSPPRVPPAASPAPPPSRARLRLFRFVSAVLLPLLLLAAAEGMLRLLDVGHSSALTVPCTVKGQSGRCQNDRFVEPFFPAGATRPPPPFAFLANKPAGRFRIFVLGESAALGDPEPAFGFSRYLEVLLRDRHPGLDLEVINASITAINSHVLLPMARELAGDQPDLFVLYIGNNEVVGPFGAGTVLTSRAPGLGLIRARVALGSTRLGQLLARLLRRGAAGGPREWRGMEMFVGQEVAADAPGLERVYGNFERNLRDLTGVARRSGAAVVLSTVATNLRDSAPFASLHREGLLPAASAGWSARYAAGNALEVQGNCAGAVAEWRAAEAIDASYAELQFRLARCALAAGDPAAAKQRFTQARDLDALRFRADTRINAIVRAVGAAAGQGVVLVDGEAALEAASADGLPGEPEFYEHVHLTPHGNYLLARALLPAVERALPPAQQAAPGAPFPGEDECGRRLALSAEDARRVSRDVFRRLEGAPFTGQLDHAARLAALARAGDAPVPSPTETLALHRAALALAPDDATLHLGVGTLLAPIEPAAALDELRAVLDRVPTHAGAQELYAGVLGRLGRKAEAVEVIHKLLRQRPDFAPAWVDLGYLLAEQGSFDAATSAYERAAELGPSLAAGLHREIGRIRLHQVRVLELQGNRSAAAAVALDGARALKAAGETAGAAELDRRAADLLSPAR